MKVWPPATCATAMENSVSAAASLIRLSPVRIAITLLGSPSLRPTATAVTASGGATIAPSTSAVPNVSGTATSQDDTAATANAVTTTRPTPRPRIGRMLRRNVGNEKSSAAEYSSGGSTTRQQDVRIQFGRLEARQERHGDADHDDDQRRFQAAAVRDGGDHDGADDDEDQFHAPIVASTVRLLLTSGRSGTRTGCGPPAPRCASVVPHTRHGSPARR